MQFRIYLRNDISYLDGGAVREYSIDCDYLASNESSINVTQSVCGSEGDFIALIEDHGAYVIGCITSVDNEALQIKFKDCRELFNDKIINPFLGQISDENLAVKYDPIAELKKILAVNFIEDKDAQRRLPLNIRTFGTAEAVWEDSSDLVELAEYINALFEKYNCVMRFEIDFDRAAVVDRKYKLLVTIMVNTATGGVLKNNISLNEFEFSTQTVPDVNTCIVFNKDDRSINSTWYLRADNTVTEDADDTFRLLPRRTTSGEYDSSNTDSVEAMDIASEKLVGNIYNHYISSKLDKHSDLIRRENTTIGDGYTIIMDDGREFGTVFSGWKDAGDRYITLIFGKARIDFTDKLKKRLRRS